METHREKMLLQGVGGPGGPAGMDSKSLFEAQLLDMQRKFGESTIVAAVYPEFTQLSTFYSLMTNRRPKSS